MFLHKKQNITILTCVSKLKTFHEGKIIELLIVGACHWEYVEYNKIMILENSMVDICRWGCYRQNIFVLFIFIKIVS